MRSSDLCERLMAFDSKQLDLELIDILGENYISQKHTDLQPPIQDQSPQSLLQINLLEQDSFSQASYTCEQTNYQNPALPLLNRRKLIHKSQSTRSQIPSSRSEESEDQSQVRRHRRNKKRRGMKEGYPTKNLLPNFKGPHIQYLQKKLGASFVNSFEIVQTIISKNGVSMKDYETLYNIAEFQETFTQFFREKVLSRQLMLSRSSMKSRKVHLKKLSVFQKAFLEKSFQRIN